MSKKAEEIIVEENEVSKVGEVEKDNSHKFAFLAYFLFFLPLLSGRKTESIKSAVNQGLVMNIYTLVLSGITALTYFGFKSDTLPSALKSISFIFFMIATMAIFVQGILALYLIVTSIMKKDNNFKFINYIKIIK